MSGGIGSVPADALSLVFGFLEPDTRAQKIGAGPLDERVAATLATGDEDPDVYSWKYAETSTRLALYRTLRAVAKAWRDLVRYETIRHLSILPATKKRPPTRLASMFGGCVSLHIDRSDAPHLYSFPAILRRLPNLRRLSLGYIKLRVFELPAWFSELPLVELRLRFDLSFEDYPWMTDESALPRSLEVLELDDTDVELDFIRRLPNLRELDMGTRGMHYEDVAPEWFHELASLRRIKLYFASPPADWADQLRSMSLEAITFSTDNAWEDEDEFLAAWDRILDGTPCGASLRELALTGYEAYNDENRRLTRLPDSLRGCRLLQRLDLSGCGDIAILPSWIGELPLVWLNLECTKVSTLPESLRTVTTLRVIMLHLSELSGPYWDAVAGEGILGWSNRVPILTNSPEGAARIARRDAVLRPLSLALPDLRFRLGIQHWADHGHPEPRMKWWHAACGHDWWEQVFVC